MREVALLSRKSAAGPGRSGAPSHTHRFWAFLSYSHKDSDTADWLHGALEKYRVPRTLVGRETTAGIIPPGFSPIFRDRHELAASGDLGQTIREALAASRCLIVLCSPDSAKSRWTNEEILAFKKLNPAGCVLAAIVDGEPWASEMPGREAEECFPPALRQKFDSRGRPTGKRAEAIAADLRASGDGRRLGLLKIVAGMLGTGLDDLVQREQHRRHRRLTYIAAASLAGMTMTSGLAIFAFDKRDEARDQRREAEGLVSFMLGDLREKLEPIGRLDALDAVGSRALGYFEKQDKTELSDVALAQRSRALNLLGQIATARGDTDGAFARYREAVRSTGELVGRTPDDPQRLFDHAQNVFWMGEIARQRGRMDQAETAYREYQALADRMVAIDPVNPKWRMEMVYAKENIGIVLYYQRRFSAAAREFSAAVPAIEALASNNPGSAEYQGELSTLLAWLGDARRDEGRLDLAIAARERQISVLRRWLSAGETNVKLEEKLVPAQQALGILLLDSGQPALAVEQLKSAITEAGRLIATEPNNAMWKASAAGAHLELAGALLALRRTNEAATAGAAGCQLATALQDLDRSVSTWRSLRTQCRMNGARLVLAEGRLADALTLARAALESARAERGLDPIKDRYTVAAAYRLVGDVHQRMDNGQAARQAWMQGLTNIPSGIAERPREMHERATLLNRLGRSEEAQPLTRKLATIGFRNTR